MSSRKSSKKRKVHLVVSNTNHCNDFSAPHRKKSRAILISEFHSLIKQQEQVKINSNLNQQQKQAELDTIDDEIVSRGGLANYQKLSIQGHSNNEKGKFNTAKWILDKLAQKPPYKSLLANLVKKKKHKNLNENKNEDAAPEENSDEDDSEPFSKDNKPRLLDVGAITNHYLPYSNYIDCTAIDLEPQHESVLKKDFFELNPIEFNAQYNVIVLSLVINYIGDYYKRGLMLSHSYKMLADNGYCYIILPNACINNSRYLNHELFVNSLMKAIGFALISHKFSNKLCFYEFQKVGSKQQQQQQPNSSKKHKKFLFRSDVIRQGETFNNFQIILPNHQE
jgi:hypothetical protein